MRASAKILAACFVLAPLSAIGCGDALDLGNSGAGIGGSGSVEQCGSNPAGGIPACQTCGVPGDQCATPDQGNCCCSAGLTTGSPDVWQCYFNSGCCPAEMPTQGDPCDCTDAPSCTYCGERGAVTLTCGPNGTWITGTLPSNC